MSLVSSICQVGVWAVLHAVDSGSAGNGKYKPDRPVLFANATLTAWGWAQPQCFTAGSTVYWLVLVRTFSASASFWTWGDAAPFGLGLITTSFTDVYLDTRNTPNDCRIHASTTRTCSQLLLDWGCEGRCSASCGTIASWL